MGTFLLSIYQTCLDLLFPPSKDEQIVRNLTDEDIQRLHTPTLYRGTHTLYTYRDTSIRALVWQLKYKGDGRASTLLAYGLKEFMLKDIHETHLLIPIPLSKQRFRTRGFNQVTLVAEVALQGLPHLAFASDVLIRLEVKTPQTKLTRQERLKNLKGVFAVRNPTLVQGKRILLLDDVVTTGATLDEARAVLLNAGAKEVTCIALAH